MPTLNLQFPEKARGLFEPKRYKFLRGGRGSAKSWSAAGALVLNGASAKPIHWLCGREFQASIRDSVHKLLADTIQRYNLGDSYLVEKQGIYGRKYHKVNEGGIEVLKRTEFAFIGLSDQTKESIKSFEGFDGAWIEEAQVITKDSLEMLTPTIRRTGSEIWFTYNPQLDTDPIDVFANSLPADMAWVADMNWRDNPWFNEVLAKEREQALRSMTKMDYENIWEGKRRPAVQGAIYADEVAKLIEDRRYGTFPYDPFHLVHPVMDLGWNDSFSILLCQRHITQLRVIDFIEDDHKTLDWYHRELKERPYSYGTLFLPHDGGHGNRQSGKSDQQVLEGLGWRVHVLERDTNVENAIRIGRMTFPQVYMNSEKCSVLLEHLKRYRRAIPKTTGEPGPPVHDSHSHAADAYRYACSAMPFMDDEGMDALPPLNYPPARAV